MARGSVAAAAAAWPGRVSGRWPLRRVAAAIRSHAGWRRGRAGGRRVGGGGVRAAAAPGTRTDPSWAAPAGGWASAVHNGPSGKGSARLAPLPGLGELAGRVVSGKESFSWGRELKRLQNKAAAVAAHGAGRGPGGGAPTRYLRASGRCDVGGSSRAPKLCVRVGGRGARELGAARPGRHPHSSWALLTRVGSPRAGLATSRPVVRGTGPGRPRLRCGATFAHPLFGARGAGEPVRLGGSGGRAAMFLRGGLRGGEGGGHGGDCAPPPIVPGLGLGPRAMGTAVAEPPPLWAQLGGAGGHKGGAARSRPCRSRASAPAVAARLPPGNGVGGLPRPAGLDSDPPPPGGRAGNRRAARPLVRHVLPARAP
ncbi:spidroin-1-like [Pteropus medius]|uniref:spidroin-1-like n=1 Tax=Pteropus vampyrus TaxID=132908 RepID=UPI00196A708D|nr:spidroin-1-like [Pteropus giganteus]